MTFWEIAIEEVLKMADQKEISYLVYKNTDRQGDTVYSSLFPRLHCGVAGTARVSVHG